MTTVRKKHIGTMHVNAPTEKEDMILEKVPQKLDPSGHFTMTHGIFVTQMLQTFFCMNYTHFQYSLLLSMKLQIGQQ